MQNEKNTLGKNIDYSGIGILSLSHTLNDLYSNYLPQMLPFLVVLHPGFTATQAAVLVSAFVVTSSFVQPVFGYYLDSRGKRWLVHVGTLWMAVCLSLTGIFHGTYPVLVVLAALAGLGTAAFHPQASTMVNMMSGEYKAVLLSAFVAFGNFGYALGPLLLVPLFEAFGIRATIYTVFPGILVAVLLFFFAPHEKSTAKKMPSWEEVSGSLRAAAKELSAIFGVIAVRSFAYMGMLTILPLYFQSRNYSNIVASRMVTLMLFSGAIGGVIGGYISDRFGRKRLISGSLILSTPLFFAFFLTQGILSTVFLGLAGMSLLSSFSVTVVAAQEAIPDNKALAAGLSMGLAQGLGGFLVILIGRVGDIWGLGTAVAVLFLLPSVAGGVAIFMRSRPSSRSQRGIVTRTV
jgi:FSR family fosmidomycin resistance protein-like MFS transporter